MIPTGQTRTGISMPGARPAARLARPNAAVLVTLVSYLACTGLAVAAAWRSRSDETTGGTSVELLWRLGWVATVVALMLTAAWTRRVASGARTRGVPNVRPFRVAVSWLVPVVGPSAAIRQIGRLLREFDYSERRLGFWMFGLYAHTLALLGSSIVVITRYEASDELHVLDAVRRQTDVLWAQAAMSAVLTVLAARAILHADRALRR